MNPNDNQNQTNPVVNNPQDGVNSIAPRDEIPMSIEKTEEIKIIPTEQEPSQQTPKEPVPTEPVTSIFTQDLNNQNQKTESTENKDSLYNYQTNAINPNASVNLNDFRIGEEKSTNLNEMSNLESTSSQPEVKFEVQPNSQTTSSGLEMNSVESLNTTQTTNTPTNVNVSTSQATTSTNSNTVMIAVLGSILALGLVTGAYFVFFRSSETTSQVNYVGGEYQTEKIIVSQKTEVKALSEEEYKTTVKSYIERYNNNIRNSKVKLATPNLTVEQRLEIYMGYSTEILNIYTDLQNLRVPERFKDSHDKLTLSLYALNSLFDTLIIDAKNKTLTPATEKQITESVTKAEDVAAKAFNEIANSQ